MQFNTIDRIREFFTQGGEPSPSKVSNRWAMVASVVVAIALWFTFSMREEYPVFVDVPVEVVGVPSSQVLETAPPRHVRVGFVGEGWQLLNVTYRPPTVRIPAEEGTVNVAVAVRNDAGLPPGVMVQSSIPREIEVRLGERIQKKVPIALDWNVGTPQPYELLRSPRISPDSVVLSGARSRLEDIDSWPTELLHEEGVIESFQKEVALRDTLSQLIRLSTRRVVVDVRVGEFTQAERDLEVRADSLPPTQDKIQLVPDVVHATFRVPTEGPTYSRALESDDFFGIVRYRDIARDTTAGSVPVLVRTPADLDIRDVRIEPPRVEYFLVRQ